jgi:hypothetical protein
MATNGSEFRYGAAAQSLLLGGRVRPWRDNSTPGRPDSSAAHHSQRRCLAPQPPLTRAACQPNKSQHLGWRNSIRQAILGKASSRAGRARATRGRRDRTPAQRTMVPAHDPANKWKATHHLICVPCRGCRLAKRRCWLPTIQLASLRHAPSEGRRGQYILRRVMMRCAATKPFSEAKAVPYPLRCEDAATHGLLSHRRRDRLPIQHSMRLPSGVSRRTRSVQRTSPHCHHGCRSKHDLHGRHRLCR